MQFNLAQEQSFKLFLDVINTEQTPGATASIMQAA
jgi:hypothetical protein